MGAYENKPDLSQAAIAGTKRAIPPAPKPSRPRVPAKAVPTVQDLVNPSADLDIAGLDSSTLMKLLDLEVTPIYQQLHHALGRAVSALNDPPPVQDRSLAMELLGILAETLGGMAFGRLGHELLSMMRGHSVGEATMATIKDQLIKPVAALTGKAVASRIAPAGATPVGQHKDPEGVADPAASTLLQEFETRMENALNSREFTARGHLATAVSKVQGTQPSELAALFEALRDYASSDVLGAWFQSEVAIGWLNFSAKASLGRRDPKQTVMPDANRIGGSTSNEWRRTHAGFIEIEIDFPDEIDGLSGVTVGKIGVASDGPGAARILRAYTEPTSAAKTNPNAAQGAAAVYSNLGIPAPEAPTGLSLATLPVYRRLWLGTNRLNRMPDIVITPENAVEVNANSSLLAAVATGAQGSFHEIQGRGRQEGVEEQDLVEKALAPATDLGGAEGRLGKSFDGLHGRKMSGAKSVRLGELVSNTVLRARDARAGAERIIRDLLANATTSQIAP